MPDLNKGINVEEIRQFQNMVRENPAIADQKPSLVAHWVEGSRSRVELGDIVTYIGGETELDPMQMILASFAACEVTVITMHASLMNIKVESLTVEANGHFNAQSLLGIEDSPGPGYNNLQIKATLCAPDASPEQIDSLKKLCVESSPVCDTLTQSLEINLEINMV